MAHYCSDDFVSTEQARYGFIRSQPSPFLFLFGMHFLARVFNTTQYKLKGRALCTQSNSGGLQSLELHGARAAPCVISGAQDSHKGAADVALPRPTVKTSCVVSVLPWGLPVGLLTSPHKQDCEGCRNKAGKGCSHGLLTSVGNGYFVHFTNTHRAPG